MELGRRREIEVCFSAEADLVAGIAVTAIGLDAWRHVVRPAERFVAAVPIVLGVHQLIEAVVWWGLQGDVDDGVRHAAEWLYLAIAFGIVPVLVPVAVAAIEPAAHRRRTLAFVALGVGVAVALTWAVVRGPVTATIEGRHVAYSADLWNGDLLVLGYVVATCGSLLRSAHRRVRWFGGLNLVVVVLLAWLDRTALVSLWCLWAAVTSVAIAVYLRSSRGAAPSAPEGVDRAVSATA